MRVSELCDRGVYGLWTLRPRPSVYHGTQLHIDPVNNAYIALQTQHLQHCIVGILHLVNTLAYLAISLSPLIAVVTCRDDRSAGVVTYGRIHSTWSSL